MTALPATELELLESEVRSRPLPRHVAVIMDGNGRWAEAQGRRRVDATAPAARACATSRAVHAAWGSTR